jgi:hypothetical protein
MPPEELDSFTAHADSIFPKSSDPAIGSLDILPANLFAVTGDVKWAMRSLEVMDEFFHTEILDGYFAYGSSIVLFSDLERGQILWHHFSKDIPQESVSRWPDQLVCALASDFRYGYRLDQNEVFANALARETALRGGRWDL